MNIEVEQSPNGPSSEQFVFKELGKPRRIEAIRVEIRGRETLCEVTGVERGGKWMSAHSIKIADSSEGHAFLIYGGSWGIRLRPEPFSKESWDLSNSNQWGEPFKIYGSEEDILYANP